MTRWKRLFYYLAINVLVSACVTWTVLTVWQRTHPMAAVVDPIVLILPSPTPLLVATYPPSATPIPEPTEALISYQVEPGESLGVIADKFETTVDHLMRINGIDDPNTIGSGQILYVPKPAGTTVPEISATISMTPPVTNTVPASSTPTPQGLFPQVVIASVIGAGDLNSERVRLECKGEGEVSLDGWQLKDEQGNVFTFPQLTLFPRGAVDVHTGSGVNDVVSLYWGLSEPIWTPGETVTLVDNNGISRSAYRVP